MHAVHTMETQNKELQELLNKLKEQNQEKKAQKEYRAFMQKEGIRVIPSSAHTYFKDTKGLRESSYYRHRANSPATSLETSQGPIKPEGLSFLNSIFLKHERRCKDGTKRTA